MAGWKKRKKISRKVILILLVGSVISNLLLIGFILWFRGYTRDRLYRFMIDMGQDRVRLIQTAQQTLKSPYRTSVQETMEYLDAERKKIDGQVDDLQAKLR